MDTGIDAFHDNRVLDPDFAARYPGAEYVPLLAARLRNQGVDLVTIDRFVPNDCTGTPVVLMASLVGQPSPGLSLPGTVTPAVGSCAESPVIAHSFYRDPGGRASPYRHVFVFPGVRERLGGVDTHVHDLYWPWVASGRTRDVRWSERRFIAFINRNKKAMVRNWDVSLRHPRAAIRHLTRESTTVLRDSRDPWFRTELYSMRLKGITYFGEKGILDLYGQNWECTGNIRRPATRRAIQRSLRGPIPPNGKLWMLGGYRFALCLENAAFPGYLTEKLLDCLAARCIPVYLGCPDILDYVPRDCFVDPRRFSGFDELYAHLADMSEERAARMIAAGQQFLRSEASRRYRAETFADNVCDCLVGVLAETEVPANG